MLVKYIDSNYIIERLQKPSWGEVEEPDFYITMASNRVKTLIFPSEQGNPNDINSYNEEQQEAIRLATAIYTMWYFDTNYDFTNGSVSVNFGGVSMSESKTYNGEMVLPNVFDILKQANLIPTTETFIFNGEHNLYADTAINPKAFKDLQQEVERQSDVNIKQDAKLIALNDKIAHINTDGIQEDLTNIKQEQIQQNIDIQQNRTAITTIERIDEEQNRAIETNLNNINTIKTDLGDLGNQVVDVQNKANANTTQIQQNTTNITTNTTNIQNNTNNIQTNKTNIATNTTNIQNNTNNIQTNTTNITALDGRLVSVSSLLQDTINGLKTLKPFQYVGEFQAGTSYNINQAVSLNNNLYLSKEDNNTTTPPGNKWLLLNEDFATIDLTQYYTKLEVNAIRDNLQNSINTNTTNITTIRNNYLDKTSTAIQDVKGSQVHFKGSVLVNSTSSPTLTPGHELIVNGSTMTDNLEVSNNAELNTSTISARLTMGNTSTAQLDGTTNIRIGNINQANIVEGTIQMVGTQPNSLVDKQYVDNAITNNTPSVNNAVLTTGDQTINGTKTFNAPLVFPNRRAIYSTSDNMTVAHINAQSQKFIKFDFEQTTSGFQNYGWLQMNAKHSNNVWSEIFSIGFKNQDSAANQGVWMNCSNNKFSFGNPTKVSNVARPTNDNDAANKRYVDSRAVATLPNWERVYSVSNFNPIDGASINYLFMNDYEYLIYIDTYNTTLKGQTQIHFFPNFKGTNDETGDDDYITRMFLAHTGQNGKSWNTDFFTIGIFRRSQIRFLPNERNYNALNSARLNVRIYRRRQ